MQLTKHSIKRGAYQKGRAASDQTYRFSFPDEPPLFLRGKEGRKEGGGGGGKSENDRTVIDRLTAVDWARHVVRYVL